LYEPHTPPSPISHWFTHRSIYLLLSSLY
jgi:hypothetical protein